MAVSLPDGATVAIATTYGAVKTVSAITNANPGVITSAAHGLLNGDFYELKSGWQKITDRIFKAAYDFNASKKGRMLPVKSVGEALESASAKYFKESELWVKTKLPVGVVVTDNVLPKDEFKTEKVDRRRKLDEA